MSQHSEQTGHRIAFVCVQNAGRNRVATAFAERDRRDVDPRVVALFDELLSEPTSAEGDR